MNFLEEELTRTRGKQPREEARRALLASCIGVVDLADRILRKFKTVEAIDETLDKCIAGGPKPSPWKDLFEMAVAVDLLEGHLDDARRAVAKQRAREEKRRLAELAKEATKTAKSPKARVKKTPIPKVIKDEIWDHYIGNTVASVACPCCQKSKITMRDFVAGHVLSEKHGGSITCENLVPICNKCNSSMGARHMVEFCLKHWGRQPVTPRNAVPFSVPAVPAVPAEVPTVRPPPVDRISHVPASRPWKYYKHSRMFSGGHVDAGRFACEDDALAYATAKGYKGITHKTGGLAMYYFTDKICKKPRVAHSMEEPGWEYESWVFH